MIKYTVNNGYVCFYEYYAKLYKALDNRFLEILKGQDYSEYKIPTLIDGEVLSKCGYFSSFPQQLTAAAFVKPQLYNEVNEKENLSVEDLDIDNKYFTPSACLHLYPMLAGQIFDQKILTTNARVYRHESESMEKLTRLWDFTVREMVFIGSADFVKDRLEYVLEEALKLAKLITNEAYVQDANDHFYPSKKNLLKIKVQQRNSLKRELIIPVGEKKVAVASFNFHNNHFSKTFNFDNNGSTVSGCVGFGIERWIAACQEYGAESIFTNKCIK